MIRPAYYRKVNKKKPSSDSNGLLDETLNSGDVDQSGIRLYDYYKTADLVRSMPSISERIEFVSPYQKAWTKSEKKYHRSWLPALMQPRKAFAVPPTPVYFDSLNFYKYITKMRVVDGAEASEVFAEYHRTADAALPSSSVTQFGERLMDTLRCYFLAADATPEERDAELYRNMIEDAHLSLADFPQLAERRITFTPRCESFWIRAGFKHFYERQDIWSDKVTKIKHNRFACDDRRCLGELSFTMRDKLSAQIRSAEPMKNLFEFSDTKQLKAPIFDKGVNIQKEVLFSPRVFNLWEDPDILYQAPGYDADVGENQKYGRVAFKNVRDLHSRIEYWNPDSTEEELEMRRDAYVSTAVTSLFNWLNAQAHVLGHTQYTDIEKPLTSQLVLSDGKEFFFAIGQLNTIATNIDVKGFVNNITNVCCVQGPFNLYDDFDPETGTFTHGQNLGTSAKGLDENVLRTILRMILA
ncbi:mitochondrial 28S ribosomal protein s30 (PDCD9) domain-containing protein [Ditylenchus destructor]|nr:mitochondrial 28S ribosomal protein s30 (PDCD9) domain-containing protein [Ditylenchus destructor]